WKSKVGYLPENHKFPNYLTGEQVLSFYGRLSGLNNDANFNKKISEMLELMNLSQWRKTKIKKYSKGMLQKLGLAQALLNEPDLLFLDEPTDGVDPIGRKEIRDLLVNLRNKGKTIFLNSHLLSEVELICDRVAILNKGDLIKEGNVDELTRTDNVYKIETLDSIDDKTKQKVLSLDKKAGIGENEIHSEIDVRKVNEIIDLLRKNKIKIKSMQQKQSTLEELFINVIQKDNIN
ncbi:MAG: ABC transporter ATP-binding protein, partial [Ignavibacteria bacterium]